MCGGSSKVRTRGWDDLRQAGLSCSLAVGRAVQELLRSRTLDRTASAPPEWRVKVTVEPWARVTGGLYAAPVNRKVSLLWGLITAAVGVLGTLQTLLEVGSGRTFDLQLLGFWLGASAVAVYVAAFVGALAGGLLSELLGALSRGTTLSAKVEVGAFITGGVFGVLAAGFVIMQGVLFDYDGFDALGRGFMALLGVAALAAGVWAWRRIPASNRTSQPPAT